MAQEYIYKDFIYQLDEKLQHIVKTVPPRDNPKVVYKYYSISDNSISALQNLSLYTTHPYSFNDSVDSSELILNFKDITIGRFENFHRQMFTTVGFNKLNITKLFEKEKKTNFYNFRNFTYNYFTRNIGLISLTTIPFNILMWSHYTNESGFVIEFNTESLLREIFLKNKDIIAYCRSGNGAKRKQKALYKTENLESRYVSHRLHLYSRKLIDFCIKQQAGTLILKNQEDKIGIAKEQEFVLRNWSYYELQTKIKYKAEKAGIELIIG